ncbi:MAG TPA: hypothetical protein VIQ31_07470, partial [Phormidium sp.]
MTTFLERYKSGEYEQVWTELLARGSSIRNEPLLEDALAVARETMARTRTNIEMLIERLQAINYEFEDPGIVFIPPQPDIREQIASLESLAGVIPLSLRAWHEIVGTVSLRGFHPDWGKFFAFALVVDPLDYVLVECDAWKYDCDEEPFQFPVATRPDGGIPYVIEVPNASIDAPLLEELHSTTFVNYLRICFRWGGFPEFEKYRRDNEIYLKHFQKLKSKEAIPNKKSLEKSIKDTESRLQEIDSIITYLTEDLL